MAHLKLKLDNRLFVYEEANGDNISNIYYFLNNDIGKSSTKIFQDWLKDSNSWFISSNYASLEKNNGDIIIGTCLDEEEGGEELFYKNAITVSAISLYNVLTQWEKICQEMPDEVTIHLEGKELSIDWVSISKGA